MYEVDQNETARVLFLEGIKCFEKDNFSEAEKLFTQALNLCPNRLSILINLSSTQLKLGNLNEAQLSIELAYQIDPRNPSVLNQLGLIYLKIDQPKKAIDYLNTCIDLDPRYFEACVNLGDALFRLNQSEQALDYYGRALAINHNCIEALNARGNLFSELGQFDNAIQEYEKALSINQKDSSALIGISKIKKFKINDPMIETYVQFTKDADTSLAKRAKIFHCLGKIYNDLGLYEYAFEKFAEGKDLIGADFNMKNHIESYKMLKSLFTSDFFLSRSQFGLRDDQHIFIVGMPRSGTTLIEQILSSHHAIEGLGELQSLPRIVSEYICEFNDVSKFKDVAQKLTPTDILKMARSYNGTLNRTKKIAVRMIDKRPHNYELLGCIALMFPNSIVIECRRNALDNCCSMYMQNFNDYHSYNQDLKLLGTYYLEYRSLMEHWRNTLPLKIYSLNYEDVVLNFEKSIRDLLKFLQLEWDDNCLQFNKEERKAGTLSLWQVKQPLYVNSIGRWKHYEKYLGELKDILNLCD